MANLNYTNPEALYPLQSGAPGQALGSGTVPGSIYAGMMLPERMNDYRNVRDTSLEGSKLANLRSEAEYKDFLAQKPLKDVQRRLEIGQKQNDLSLLGGDLSLRAIRQQGELSRAPKEEVLKMAQALGALSSQEAAAYLSQIMSASSILKQFPENMNPEIAIQELKRAGIDLGGMDQAHLKGIRNMDPQSLKDAYDREKTTFTETQQTGRTLDTLESQERIAGMRTKEQSVGEAKIKHLNDLKDRLIDLQESYYKNGQKWSSHRDQAEYNAINTILRSAEATGQANLQVQTQSGSGAINALQGKPPGVDVSPPAPNVKGQKETINIPEVGEVEVITREGNRVRIYDPKTGKFGWYEP